MDHIQIQLTLNQFLINLHYIEEKRQKNIS